METRRGSDRCELGNIDQNQYVDKVRTLMDFIAPRILKEDIETIWKMQVRTKDASHFEWIEDHALVSFSTVDR